MVEIVSQARIDVRGVSKQYPRPGRTGESFTVLSDISLSASEGEFISLIGTSGCGKTTLLRMMSGLIPCDQGSIYLSGQRVRGVPPAIGFVFQEPALLPWRTVFDNLAFALKPKRLSREEVERRIAESLDLTGLREFARYYPHMLSGGMQQRVGLARALVGDPDVLFMDEPLSALDALTRRHLQEDIAAIVERSRATTVLVTHDVDEAIFFSDRIIVMGVAPGSIREVVEVALPRPRRHVDLLDSAQVAQLRDRVLGIVLGLA